jgi:L-alanine-DL-glutamate epimerase-like enolase superfamily enzyme
MKWLQVAVTAGLAASLAMVLQAEQGGGRAGGTATAGTSGALIGGTLTPAKPDARGWGWQVKASIHALGPYPPAVVFEYNYGAQPIPYLNEFVTFKEGKLYPNDRPGLGVAVNMERLRLVATFSEPGPNRPT